MLYRVVVRVIAKNGWVLVRVNGSHYQFRKSGSPYVVTVPCHREISDGVIKDIERKTGLRLR